LLKTAIAHALFTSEEMLIPDAGGSALREVC